MKTQKLRLFANFKVNEIKSQTKKSIIIENITLETNFHLTLTQWLESLF